MKNLIKKGEIFIWLTGLGLGISLVMISGLMFLIVSNSTDYFYPAEVTKVQKKDNTMLLGQIFDEQFVPDASLPDSLSSTDVERYQFKIGNRDIYGYDFVWADEREIASMTIPEEAIVIERTEYGNFYGFITAIQIYGKNKFNTKQEIDKIFFHILDKISDVRNQLDKLEKGKIGEINYYIEQARLEIEQLTFHNKKNLKVVQTKIDKLQDEIDSYQLEYEEVLSKTDSLRSYAANYKLVVNTVDGTSVEIPFLNIIRKYKPNGMNLFSKSGFIISKIWEFVSSDPRESNTEGGVLPAIFGTIMLVVLMSVAVVPFGVIAALYLREYAKQGVMVRFVRIAVNNLAGVPSIVFGVFGLGFFIYFVGGTIDQLFYPEKLPTPTYGTGGILWASLTLALLTLPVVIVATEESLASIPRGIREASIALGATKWQTIRRIVLPSAAPGILTGIILSMARAAGEVAPLMITGVVKLAPNLPIDGYFPFFHLDRKFMHLGFHIYDVGFQSPNVEAALPMVYMTTLLLIVIVILLNLTAMITRARLRKKYQTSTF
ncbi:MAG: phosphate ABC transporter, permease protein PstA [Ignavibacteria bacterium CG2_30_36_16]|nr:phosphate ABC transporter permease PstA [Ignavibacteria bacterium]OIP62287.1 MAG: phosphate ABC transporter, permease protein PstA [Ignavibacteria bacterium CG2_30_36_16]